MLCNIQSGILDTPTKAYIPKLITFTEHLYASNILIQHHNDELSAIVKKRKVMTKGKRVIPKDQVFVTTEKIYGELKTAEEATKKSNRSSGRGRRGRIQEECKLVWIMWMRFRKRMKP